MIDQPHIRQEDVADFISRREEGFRKSLAVRTCRKEKSCLINS